MTNLFRNLLPRGLFFALMFLPLATLLGGRFYPVELDSELTREALANTYLLAVAVLFVTTIIGAVSAWCMEMWQLPRRSWLHWFLLLPLAFPAYVMAYLYLAAGSPGSPFYFINLQGQLGFLIFSLSLSLFPYIYFFCCLGFRQVSAEEWETEQILKAGHWSFFRFCLWPHLWPYWLSAAILVVFETLADFGAASMINVPVITTLIYKTWFDLFSFEGAIYLSSRYVMVIMALLTVELLLRQFMDRQPAREILHWSRPQMNNLGFGLVFLFLGILILFSGLFPLSQLIFFVADQWNLSFWTEAMSGFLVSFTLALVAATMAVFLAWCLSYVLRSQSLKPSFFQLASTFGYAIPGTLLAVAVYAILLKMFPSIDPTISFIALCIALAYKFFTVAMRPLADRMADIPRSLDETSAILQQGVWQKFRHYLWPNSADVVIVGFLMIFIEVMKEMPLTLMLAPSEMQSLSIQIFNFTSEGEWGRAAIPSLLLVGLGMISVSFLAKRGSEQ